MKSSINKITTKACLTLVRIARNHVTIFVSYPLAVTSHTLVGHTINSPWMSLARDKQTAENCQTEKRGRNEIITVDKILLTNQMMLIVNCDFSSIVFVGCTQQRRLCF